MKRRTRGQALVELALIAPVLLVLLLITVDVGRVFSEWVVLTNAAREGAYTAASTVSDPSTPTPTTTPNATPSATPNATSVAMATAVVAAVVREGSSVGIKSGEVAVSYPTDSANGTADIAQVTVSHGFSPISPFVGSVLNLATPVTASASFRFPLQTPTPVPVAPTATFAYINDNDTGITYCLSGCGWAPVQRPASNDLNLDVHVSSKPGDYMTYSFSGSGISLITEVGSDEGQVDVYLDGTSKGTVDLYRAAPTNHMAGQVVYDVQNLTPGTHSLKLVHSNSCTSGSTGCLLVVDALRVTLGGYVVSTTASPASFPRGQTVTLSVTVTGLTASNIQLNVTGSDPSGNSGVAKWDPAALTAGQPRTFVTSSTIPAGALTGTYTVKVSIYQAGGGGAVLYLNTVAATFIVT